MWAYMHMLICFGLLVLLRIGYWQERERQTPLPSRYSKYGKYDEYEERAHLGNTGRRALVPHRGHETPASADCTRLAVIGIRGFFCFFSC